MPDTPLPLFPLGTVMLPGEPVPLHIFEPRYREMVRDCLDGEQPFGIVYATETGMAEVGCTARIRRVITRYDDGRLDILTVGESRFRVEHVRRERSYLTADVRAVEDAAGLAAGRTRQRVVARHMKLLEMAGETPQPTLYDEPTPLSFVVGRNAGLSLEAKQRLLAMESESVRLTYLAEHLARLLRRIRRARHLRDRAQGDGQASGFPEPGAL